MARTYRRRQAEPPPEPNTVALLGEAYSALGHRIVAGVVEAGFPQRPAHSAVFAHIGRTSPPKPWASWWMTWSGGAT
jgi:hypothetical protein